MSTIMYQPVVFLSCILIDLPASNVYDTDAWTLNVISDMLISTLSSLRYVIYLYFTISFVCYIA